jgi:hypothetical protein
MRRIKALAIFNTLSFILQVAFSYLTQTTFLTEDSATGDLSAQYETLLTPSPVVFTMWLILYTTLGVHCLYHLVMAYKHDRTNPANDELSRMGSVFIILNLSAAAWLAWGRGLLVISVIFVFIQLLCLVMIHRRLHIYSTTKAAALKVATQFPFSIYLGWISMISIINMAAYLQEIGWDGFGLPAYQWAIIMITFVILLSTWMILFRKNIYFGLVAALVLYGIIEKRTSLHADDYEALIVSSWAGIGIIGLLCIIQLVRNLQYKKPRAVFPSPSIPVK